MLAGCRETTCQSFFRQLPSLFFTSKVKFSFSIKIYLAVSENFRYFVPWFFRNSIRFKN
jgi:hypothetical protein